MAERTKDRLARDLLALAPTATTAGQQARLSRIVQAAERGIYDDYESPLAMPLHALVEDLTALGLPEAEALVERVKDGVYDGTKEESDAWAASPEGRETFRALVEGRVAPSDVGGTE